MLVDQDPEEVPDRLDSALRALVPKRLDDVIKYHRQYFQLRLSTDLEIFDLYITISPAQPKDIIDDWNLITFVTPDFSAMWLLGEVRRKGCPRITSDVIGIDLNNGFLTTRSGSLYELGKQKNGPPSREETFLVCASFHKTALGIALGVPHFLL